MYNTKDIRRRKKRVRKLKKSKRTKREREPLAIQEINGYATATKNNRFHKRKNPVKILQNKTKKEQKV